MRRSSPTPLLLALLMACKGPELALDLPEGTADRDDPLRLIAVPNLDDDDEDGTTDFQGSPDPADDDLVEFFLADSAARGRGKRHLSLRLEGDVDQVRIWHKGQVVLGNDDGTLREHVELDRDAADRPFKLEVGAPLTRATLSLVLGDDEQVVSVPIQGAPLLLNHHLQPAEQVLVLHSTDFGYSNDAMVDDLEEILGDRLTKLSASTYQWDVWVQDEPEFGTFTAPGHRLDLVIDSVRNGQLDPLPEDLREPGTTSRTWGQRNYGTTYDSFGNFEVTPPVTVDGVEYPFGRAYWGGTVGNGAPDVEMTNFLDAQSVQAPFSIDTTWLCVGHVDEFVAFVPDPTAPRGFRFLVSDIPAGYDVLEGMDPETELPRYAPARAHGLATVGEMLEEPGLREYNEALQRDHIDPAVEIFRKEIGLTDEEIVRFPALFEEEVMAGYGGVCGAVSLIPGSINMLVVQPEGEPTHVFMADPFLRSDVTDQASDPMIEAITEIMPKDLQLHFVDDWEVYHLGLGEVHCATNTRRTPIEDWWTTAGHLLGEGE